MRSNVDLGHTVQNSDLGRGKWFSVYCVSQADTGISCSVLCLHLFKLCWQIEEDTQKGWKTNFEIMPYRDKLRAPFVPLFSMKETLFVYTVQKYWLPEAAIILQSKTRFGWNRLEAESGWIQMGKLKQINEQQKKQPSSQSNTSWKMKVSVLIFSSLDKASLSTVSLLPNLLNKWRRKVQRFILCWQSIITCKF